MMLEQAVIDAWHRFSEPLEGRIHHMYLDVLGLVTCGVGLLIDPIALALPLPWKHPDGRPATQAEIRDAWNRLKARQDLASQRASHALEVTGLVLSDADIDALVAKKLSDDAEYIKSHHFPAFEEFPADAQLAIMSMAWALGAGFPAKFPLFTEAVLGGDWARAQANATIREEGNPGVIARNRANRICFANAEIARRCGMPRDLLGWPSVLQPSTPPKAEEAAPVAAIRSAALEEARLHALELTRLSGLRELSELDSDPAAAGAPANVA